MVISHTAGASQDLSHLAPVFVTCSVEESGLVVALMSAERVQCHVAKLSACRRFAVTRPRHLRRSCRCRPGLATRDITRLTTRRGLTRRTLLAVSVVVVVRRQQDRHLCLTTDVADICSLCRSSIVAGDWLKMKTCHDGYTGNWQLCWTKIYFPLLLTDSFRICIIVFSLLSWV